MPFSRIVCWVFFQGKRVWNRVRSERGYADGGYLYPLS